VARILPDDPEVWTAADRLYAHHEQQRGRRVWPSEWPPLTSERLDELSEEAEAELDEEEEE
jgi:hypothetical protein